ncbi:MAG: hypothetical protein ACO1OT_19085 [Heyndrickxia sp.]
MKNDSIALTNKSVLFMKNYQMFEDLQRTFQSDYKAIFNYIKSIFSSYYTNDIGGKWEFEFKEDRGYHKIYKPSWKKDKIDIHFELSMNIKSLISGEITYMLDIEGNKKNDFLQKYNEFLKNHLKDDIKYRSSKRRDTFAHKKAVLLTKENLENERFLRGQIVQLISDFNSIIEPLDSAMEKF